MRTLTRSFYLGLLTLGGVGGWLAMAKPSPAAEAESAAVAVAGPGETTRTYQVGNSLDPRFARPAAPATRIDTGRGHVVETGPDGVRLNLDALARPSAGGSGAAPLGLPQISQFLPPGIQLGPQGVVIDRDGLHVDTRSGASVEMDRPGMRLRVTEEGLRRFAAAKQAFGNQRYQEALREIEAALREMPDDARFQQFDSLVRFALGDYGQAAAAARKALAGTPAWDWRTMSGFFQDADAYADLYRMLQRAAEQDKQSPDLQFLLGYHYLMQGHQEAAVGQLERAAQLLPRDPMVRGLIDTLIGRPRPEAPRANEGSTQ